MISSDNIAAPMQPALTANSLVILTICYNSSAPLEKLARTLNFQTIKPSEWILVDNSPLMNPTTKPYALFPSRMLSSNEGDGFGKGCNTGIELLRQESFTGWIWLLNPDTVLMSHKYVEDLLSILDSVKSNTLLGTAIVDSADQIENSAGWIKKSLNYRKSHIPHNKLCTDVSHFLNVDWLSGCNLIYKPSAFPKPLKFDSDFPLYFEDIDFCLRAKANSGHCIWTNKLKICHQQGTGSNCTTFRRERLKAISQINFLIRYLPWWIVIAHMSRLIALAILRFPLEINQSRGKICGIIQATMRKRG